ncbi:ribosome assembly cofactor RimP [Synechococcus sp. CCY9202]|uniref:ribosome assembly cofactor RimP n=1 Tax=Synechococcus sp. CCY9202 TaxID=174698 RepID=UPI002B21D127|nr:ribosome assembly cofactor RimP [Synechococcus sp. CCY9202]MEA5423501.1 ribosome assembly cofactor RimP [Synechococcus sp. CCY9202]
MPHPLIPDLLQLAAPVASTLALEVREVQLHTHRIPLTLQVVVQRSDGADINLDECAGLSGPLGEAIEASGLLTEAYVLEITSPGIGEDLHEDRDFRSFRGFPVEVSFHDPKGLRTSLEGLLLERDATDVRLNQRGRTVRIPRDAVIRVRLITPDGSA